MEFIVSFPTAIVATVFVCVLALTYHLLHKPNAAGRNRRPAPQAAGAWPLIGHLHLLGGPQQPHITLGKMADKYGPIFTIKIGVHQALVVSDREVAKDIFTTNDRVFATRPKSVVVELMGYNYAMFGLGPYNSYWRQMRKIVVVELLSPKRLEMLAHIRASEIQSSIRDIYYEVCCVNNKQTDKVKIEMKQRFGNMVLNVVVRMISGKRFSPGDEEGVRFQDAAAKFFKLLGTFLVSDAIPYVRWLDLGGYEKAMKMISMEMDNIFEGWLEEHRRMKNSGVQIKGEQQVFMDVLISIVEGASKEDLAQSGFDPDTIIKSTCLVILAAGTESTEVALTWALTLVLNNPKVLKNVRHELTIHVGGDRRVEESDLKNLVYLQAVIKETLRLYPPGPITFPHESMEDCIVGGYNIPKGTRLLVNIWKIQHDPRIWSDPYEFRPERFLTSQKEVDVRGQHYELIPFGSGRRMCPGVSLAFPVLQLTLASLIHGFDIEKPLAEPIDMSQSFGLAIHKATPLDVLLTPRLSPNLYK